MVELEPAIPLLFRLGPYLAFNAALAWAFREDLRGEPILKGLVLGAGLWLCMGVLGLFLMARAWGFTVRAVFPWVRARKRLAARFLGVCTLGFLALLGVAGGAGVYLPGFALLGVGVCIGLGAYFYSTQAQGDEDNE